MSGSSSRPARRLEELQAGERVARERYELYRAKVYGPRPTSLGRLRDLDQAWKLAQSRLHRARAGERRAGERLDPPNGNRPAR